jgi:tetratricopeptide (TPR) repeat protein
MDEPRVVASRFVLGAQVGAGGMGLVFRATDRDTGQPVAVKLFRSAVDKRFAREANVLSAMRHPCIVRYVAHGTTVEGEPYLVMEWVEGETLSARLRRAPLSLKETVALGARLGDALDYAHAHAIVHRDVKPGNVLLEGGRTEAARLIDFGIARPSTPSAQVTMTGDMIGTPGYMAPEQARGERNVGSPADVFSLGCILYCCLTGTAPFKGESPIAVLAKVLLDEVPPVRERRPETPRWLDDLVAKMLAKDPEARPDLADVRSALARTDALPEDDGAKLSVPTDVPAPPPSREAITDTEQRVVTVVLASSGSAAPVTAETLETRVGPPPAIARIAASVGAHAEALAGGAIVVTVTAAGSATDQVARAARCALAMRRELKDAAMVLATGRAVLAARLPFGDAVDRAARMLERARARAPERGVLIDDVSAALIDPAFAVRTEADGSAVLVGEQDSLLAVRTLLGRATPCVGRESELATLDALLSACVEEPSARAVVVIAGAGVGKSRLGHELIARALRRHPSLQVWVARADPISAGSPFGMLGQALRRASGGDLAGLVARYVEPSEARRVREFLGELMGAPESAPSVQLEAARADAMLMGDQMARAWETLAESVCRKAPVLLVLEDLQWGDLPTVRFVDTALRHLEDLPFMVLALARPEVHDLFGTLWAARASQEMRLSELRPRASEQLVRKVLGPTVPAETVSRIVGQSAGNAFFLEELVRAVAEGHGDKLPDSAIAMAEGRLQALEPDARKVLRAASVFGQAFWPRGVAELVGGQNVDVWLSVLAERELVAARHESRFAGEQEYVFRHALVREAAYAMSTGEDRALGHRLAGTWLEGVGETDAATLAEHFERGREPARAIAWYLRAAKQALEGNDVAATLARCRRGLACAEEAGASGELVGALYASAADAHKWRGEQSDALRCALEAMKLLPRGGALWYAAAGEVINASGRLGDRATLTDVIAEARDPALPAAFGPRVIALARAVVQLSNAGRYDEAEQIVRGFDATEPQVRGDPSAMARIHQARFVLAVARGEVDTIAFSEAAIACFDQAGDARSRCGQLGSLGYTYMALGLFDRAERALREAMTAAERTGAGFVAEMAKHNLGYVLAHTGKAEEGGAIERESIETFRALGDKRMEGGARFYLAAILAVAGDVEQAEAYARSAVDVLGAHPPAKICALGVLADVLLRRGRAAEALSVSREGMALLDTLGTVEEGEALLRLAHAEALDASGDRDAARAVLATAARHLEERASRISPRYRDTFLGSVREHARIRELQAAWG